MQSLQRLICTIFALILISTSLLAEELQQFSSEELRDRYIQLIDELRCPQCQNQNLQDSDSPIAQDLRGIVLTKLEEGQSDKQITDYLINRYGDFITYMPRFKKSTYGLWVAPIALFFVALIIVFLLMRRQRSINVSNELNVDEQQRLQELLDQTNRQLAADSTTNN
jgi:cytochrome c-type biogenesis protein CcmH